MNAPISPPELKIDLSAPVLITGGNGYLALWLVKRLLEEGLTVHATVRDPSNEKKVKHLKELDAAHPGTLRIFKADLLDEGSFAEAMAGTAVVFHTASPFRMDVKDAQKELVDPALEGTRNVLKQANQTPSVKRVVLTSSCVAVYGDNVDLLSIPEQTVNESNWNETSTVEHQPYSYSKTVAEREAWKLAEGQSQWDMVVMNPPGLFGPGINPFATSESFAIAKTLGDGSGRAGIPILGFGVTDVRDAAEAHLRAAFLASASGRNIILGHNTSLMGLADALRPKYGKKWPIPRFTSPKFLVWLVGPIVNGTLTRKYISNNVGLGWKGDNSKGVRELGMSYRPLEETMNDMFQQLIDTKQLG